MNASRHPGRIAIELVPRSLAVLEQELNEVATGFPAVDTINIPDIFRLEMRSTAAAMHACSRRPGRFAAIPHLRAIDFALPAKELIHTLRSHCYSEVLVVTGDAPRDMSRRVYRTRPVELIRILKAEIPDLKVFAAIDPYRSGLRAELDYAQEKMDAGADGFFTQPFFDLRFMEIYADALASTQVFWGVTPVLDERARNYWETRNQVVFPKGFSPDLAWSRAFAADALAFVKERSASIYFMPIKVSVCDYLGGIL